MGLISEKSKPSLRLAHVCRQSQKTPSPKAVIIGASLPTGFLKSFAEGAFAALGASDKYLNSIDR